MCAHRLKDIDVQNTTLEKLTDQTIAKSFNQSADIMGC